MRKKLGKWTTKEGRECEQDMNITQNRNKEQRRSKQKSGGRQDEETQKLYLNIDLRNLEEAQKCRNLEKKEETIKDGISEAEIEAKT